MDMPIRIMITLFVALIVGSTIIVFSKTMIDQSKLDIEANRPGVDPSKVEDQKIIQLAKIDETQIIDLVLECYKKNIEITFEKELCFAVIAKEAEWNPAEIEGYYNDDHPGTIKADVIVADDVMNNDYAFNIYFDPYGNNDRILISR